MSELDSSQQALIIPDWPAPHWIKAIATTRQTIAMASTTSALDNDCASTTNNYGAPIIEGQKTADQFAFNNLALHVGDDEKSVLTNRRRLNSELNLPSEPYWLNQTHSTIVTEVNQEERCPEADASISQKPGEVCVVMTADCLPILLTNRQGDWIAACHAGWRGLCDGILLNTINRYSANPKDLMGWIGPAISQKYFEVGAEVKEAFIRQDAEYEPFFVSCGSSKFLADLIGIARHQCEQNNVKVYGGQWCSFADASRFYSYRRDGVTGRMASLIWIDPTDLTTNKRET